MIRKGRQMSFVRGNIHLTVKKCLYPGPPQILARRVWYPRTQIVRQSDRRLVALLPCHEPKKPCYFRDRPVLVPTQGSARSCPNCRKRCLNELEEWSKKLPPDVRTGVIWTSFTVFFHEKLSSAPSCPGDCQRLVTLRALGNFFFYSPYDRRIV